MHRGTLGISCWEAEIQRGTKALGGHKVDPEPAKCPWSHETQKQHQLQEEEPWQHVKGGANSSLSALECLVQCWAAQSMDTVGFVRSHKDNKGVTRRDSENCGCLAWRREDFWRGSYQCVETPDERMQRGWTQALCPDKRQQA